MDDYLKEYNKDEVVTLSGELEIEHNDFENNNGTSKDIRHKPRKTKRKSRDERRDTNANGRDVSPKVFKTGSKSKQGKSGMLFIYIKCNALLEKLIESNFKTGSELSCVYYDGNQILDTCCMHFK